MLSAFTKKLQRGCEEFTTRHFMCEVVRTGKGSFFLFVKTSPAISGLLVAFVRIQVRRKIKRFITFRKVLGQGGSLVSEAESQNYIVPILFYYIRNV